MAGPDEGRQDQLSSLKDVRALLAKRNYRSDAWIGRQPFVDRIWSCVEEPRPSDATQRGRALRVAVWDLIEQHHTAALEGAAPCTVCAHIADAATWHVLWLENTFTVKEGFEPRYTHGQLVAVGSYAAADGQMAQVPLEDVPLLLGLEREGRLQPAEFYPIRRRRGLRWYGEKATCGCRALCAHLRPGDSKLQSALARQGLRLRSDAVSNEAGAEPAPAEEQARDVARADPAARGAELEGATTDHPVPLSEERAEPEPEASEASRATGARDSEPLKVHTTRLFAGLELPSRQVGPVNLSRRRLVELLCALVLLLVSVSIASDTSFFPIPPRPIAAAHIEGFFVARQWVAGSARTLYVVDARSGESRPLWPDAATLQGESATLEELGNFLTLFSPAYLPSRHLLAFIAEKGTARNLWLAPVEKGLDGWPRVAADPREMVDNCTCNAVTWSPSGDWLIYDSSAGLTAVSPGTFARRRITNRSKDRWPACSPNGEWLAFQNSLDDIMALPTHDCIPVPVATSSARYLNGYRVAWSPAWSVDSSMLAFVSNQGGPTRVYAIPFERLARNISLADTAPALQLSEQGCMDPLWVLHQSTHERLVVFTCAPSTPSTQHRSLVAVPATPNPTWQGLLDEGTLGRDSVCWLPE